MTTLQVDQASLIAAIRREAMEEAARIAVDEMSCTCGFPESHGSHCPFGIAARINRRAMQQTQENTNGSDETA